MSMSNVMLFLNLVAAKAEIYSRVLQLFNAGLIRMNLLKLSLNLNTQYDVNVIVILSRFSDALQRINYH